MKDYESIVTQFKSDLTGLLNERSAGYSYSQWFNAMAEIIGKHLGVNRLVFFIYDRNRRSYTQLKEDDSLSNDLLEVYEGVVNNEGRLISAEILSSFQGRFEWPMKWSFLARKEMRLMRFYSLKRQKYGGHFPKPLILMSLKKL